MRSRFLIVATIAPFALVTACGKASNEAVANEVTAEVTEITEAAVDGIASEVVEVSHLANITSGTYALDKGHGYITMTYDHQGYSNPYIRYVGFDSILELNIESPLESSVTVNIDPASIDTGVEAFDNHLKSADFFDVEVHKDISFVSTALEMTGVNTGKMTGTLTLKGITKPVTLDVTLNKADFYQRAEANKIGFSAKGTLNRSDWDLGAYVPFVGDRVDLIIETEFVQQN